MTRFAFCCVVVLAAVGVVGAQSSAKRQAESWFSGPGAAPETRLARLSALTDKDLELWESAAKKIGVGGSRADLGFTLMKFNPLFDSKNQVIPGAVAKYVGRLEQLPKTAIDEWTKLTEGYSLIVAISLTAENAVFPGDKFSAEAFRLFAAKFK